jgi:branched-chain amino acid aminotransferase
MHKWASLNGKLIAAREAALPMISSAGLYGKGIFTTVAVREGKLFLWEKHWRRLIQNAETVGLLTEGLNEGDLSASLLELIAANDLHSGRARITLFDGRAPAIWATADDRELIVSVITGDRHIRQGPFRVAMSTYDTNSRSPLSGVKSCNYLDNILAIGAANKFGFCEAIRLNERGHITSGCMSNVFWKRSDKWYTPSLSTGCLAGTTREHVLENIECEEVEAKAGELDGVDAIFMTSAGIGVCKVAEFNSRMLSTSDVPVHLWPGE